jgi:hypothetical protein
MALAYESSTFRSILSKTTFVREGVFFRQESSAREGDFFASGVEFGLEEERLPWRPAREQEGFGAGENNSAPSGVVTIPRYGNCHFIFDHPHSLEEVFQAEVIHNHALCS